MVTEEQRQVLRALQSDLSCEARPFRELAGKVGLTEARFLEVARELKRSGIIRRFGALVAPGRAGLAANALVVWRVSEGEVGRVGRIFSGSRHVSHCYERRPLPDFEYNVYTMVHAGDVQERDRIVAALSEETGCREYVVLATKRELKRSDPAYW